MFGIERARMAVPKKKTSMSLGKAVLSGRAQGFVYPMPEEAETEE
jgi:large subunit ribosomal protein L32